MCARNRWGKGTTCEKPTNTPASKELQERLAAMRNERTAQDKMWDTEPLPESVAGIGTKKGNTSIQTSQSKKE